MFTGLTIGRRYHTIINSGNDYIQEREATNITSWYNPTGDSTIDTYYNRRMTSSGSASSNLEPRCLTLQIGKNAHTIKANQTTPQIHQKINSSGSYIKVYLHWSTTYQLVGFTIVKNVSGTDTVIYTLGEQTEYSDEVQIACSSSLYVSSDVVNSAHIAFALILQRDWSWTDSNNTTRSYKGWILRIGMYKTYDTGDIDYFVDFEPISGSATNYLPSSLDMPGNSWGATSKSMGENCQTLTSVLATLEDLGVYKSITAEDFAEGIIATTRNMLSKLFPQR